jgi:hypothetical protein
MNFAETIRMRFPSAYIRLMPRCFPCSPHMTTMLAVAALAWSAVEARADAVAQATTEHSEDSQAQRRERPYSKVARRKQ